MTDPARDTVRPWLELLDDEQAPVVTDAAKPDLVVWSSLWPKRPDARIRFDLAPDDSGGTSLRWALLLAEPAADPSLLGHLRKRLNLLINGNLRHTFGQ